MENKLIITVNTFNKIISYLQQCPYKNVAGLIEEISKGIEFYNPENTAKENSNIISPEQ